MTKENWINHMEEDGIVRPSLGGSKADWSYAQANHKHNGCVKCRERAKTQRANASARAKHDAYTSCGLVRVKGALGGIYYE